MSSTNQNENIDGEKNLQVTAADMQTQHIGVDKISEQHSNQPSVKSEPQCESDKEVLFTGKQAAEIEEKETQQKTSNEETVKTEKSDANFSDISSSITQTNEVPSNKGANEDESVKVADSTQTHNVVPDKTNDPELVPQQQSGTISSKETETTIKENVSSASIDENADKQQPDEVVMVGTSDQPSTTNKNTTTTTSTPLQQQMSPTETSAEKSDHACSLWIRNIATATKAVDLKALFSKHAKVVTAKIFTTKNKQSPTCFGYVSLADPESADLCVQKLNRSNFKGRIISVEKADRSNLSQIKNVSGPNTESRQQQKSNVKSNSSTRSSKDATDIIVLKQKKSKTSEDGRSVRPRITASGELSSDDLTTRRSVKSYDTRKHYNSGNPRLRVASYSRIPQRLETTSADQYPMRRVVQTSRGIRVSTSTYAPYNARMAREEFSMAGGNFSHRNLNAHRGSRELQHGPSNDNEREEIIRLMRHREEEHRKKEEELRLEREREKLKYEREKLEREKLELETLKLQAQLAQAANLLPTNAPTSANLLRSASATQQYILQQYHRDSHEVARRDTRDRNKERKVATKRLSPDEDRSSSRQRTRRTSSIGKRDQIEKGRRPRLSRSPIRRTGDVIESVPYHRDRGPIGIGHSLKPDRESDSSRRDERAVASSYTRNAAALQAEPYAKRYYSGTTATSRTDLGQHDRTSSHRRISPATGGHREYFGSGSQTSRYGAQSAHGSTNLSTDSYAARTDPSYASRIGQTVGARHPDEMFGSSGFGMNTHQDATFGQQSFGRDPPTSSSSYFQNTNWGDMTDRNDASSSTRAYNLWSSSGNWNAYGSSGQQASSASGNRFSTSTYSKQGEGSSYIPGRRY